MMQADTQLATLTEGVPGLIKVVVGQQKEFFLVW